MFITFEGIEGCGKSTQAKRLFDRLCELGIATIFTREPGGTKVGQDIRRILLDFRNQDLTPLAELLLYAADRAQHVKGLVKPGLAQGKWVICDRFFDATTAYQGHARGQDITLIRLLNEKASFGIRPDITFLLDCPVEVGLERALKREYSRAGTVECGQDRFEKEKREFHDAVRKGYLSMAGEDNKRFVILDSTLSVEKLEDKIFNHIKPSIP